METKQLTCVICPVGCRLLCSAEELEVVAVSGQECARGEKYARAEMTAPVRSFTTTIAVAGGSLAVLPVRTSGPIPKDRVFDCLREARKLTASGPVERGQVLLDDVLGLGVALIACRDMS